MPLNPAKSATSRSSDKPTTCAARSPSAFPQAFTSSFDALVGQPGNCISKTCDCHSQNNRSTDSSGSDTSKFRGPFNHLFASAANLSNRSLGWKPAAATVSLASLTELTTVAQANFCR
jgi:hypothetical protein